MFQYPLTQEAMNVAEAYEHHLLKRYAEEASLVLTSLLHVASPCLGLGVPVILCRGDRDSRFGLIEQIIPLYTPERFDEIDWNPEPTDVAGRAAAIENWVHREIAFPASV